MSRTRIWMMLAVVTAGAGVLVRSVPAYFEDPPAKTGEAATIGKPVTKEEADKWMRIKLKSSQQILAGLTSGDPKAIEENARRMLVLNVLENWQRENKLTRQSDYEAQLNAFEFATKELIRTGHDKDIDGALEAYTMLTKSCVKCHQLIRDQGAAK